MEILLLLIPIYALFIPCIMIIDLLLSFWKRKPAELYYAIKVQKLKLFWLNESYWEVDKSGYFTTSKASAENNILLWTWAFYDIFLLAISITTLGFFIWLFVYSITAFLILIVILLIIIVPRYINDIFTMLQYSNTMKQSARLVKLESEINKLKNK